MQTYSERRQTILFRASRELRKVAVDVLGDVNNPAELTGRTAAWAKGLARQTAEQANQLETIGHERCIATTRAERALYRAHREYEEAIDRFEERLRAHGVDPSSLETDEIRVHKIGT